MTALLNGNPGSWDVPGYEVLELLGFGTSGEVWRARERSSGLLVVLRRLAGGDRAAVTAVKAQATIVRSLPSAHVIRLRCTTRANRDDVLVLDHAAGGSLATLLRRRTRLEPGEVVTAVAPLAEVLGQAHAHELVHGRLDATCVLLSAEGMPLLDGLGMASLYDVEDSLDPTGALGPAADVWALGALAHQLLTGEQPGTTILATLAPRAPLPLVRAIESALSFDPANRPSAADLAAALLAACPPLPLEGIVPVPEPVTQPRRRAGRSRRTPRVRFPRFSLLRSGRTAVLGGALLIALVVAAVSAVGWAWGSHSTDQPTTVAAGPAAVTRAEIPHPTLPTAAPPTTRWADVVGGLDQARAAAYEHADPSRLAAVYAPGAGGLATDRTALSALATLRRTVTGVRHQVRTVTPVTVTRDRAELRVVETLGACQLLDGAGRVLEVRAAAAPATHEWVLVSTSSGWRVQQVRTL